MIGSRLIKSNDVAAGCEDIVDAYDPFGDSSGLALYQLNGNANDVSTNYNGNFINPNYVTGVFGQAGFFDGTTSNVSCVDLPDSLAEAIGVNDFTFSLWINPTAFTYNGTGGIPISFVQPLTAYLQLNTDGTINFFRYDGTGYGITSNISLTTNSWYHIVAYQSSTDGGRLYINGSLVGQDSFNANLIAGGSYQSIIGGYVNFTYPNFWFQGSIDQTRIFNRALTPLEVEALYTEELCICGGTVDTLDILNDSSCIALYPLDGNANDLSGNYSGTSTNVSYGVGEFDLAGVFNGSSSNISIGSPIANSNSDFSISIWFKTSGFSGVQGLIGGVDSNRMIAFYLRNISGNSYTIELERGFGTVRYYSNDYATVNLPLNSWNHISLIYVASTRSITTYLNNQFNETQDLEQTQTGQTLNSNLAIGQYSDVALKFDGSIDQVRIFNKALSAGEVTTLYNETACTPAACTSGTTNTLNILGDGSCIAAYPLDGSPLDLSGNYNGVQTDVTYPQGYFDLAGSFNGVSSRFQLNVKPTASLFTASFWINFNNVTKRTNIYGDIHPEVVRIGFSLGIENGLLYLVTDNDNTGNWQMVKEYTQTILVNQWYNIVLVSNGSSNKLYINNAEASYTFIVGSQVALNDSANNVEISFGGNDRAINGSIDQVRIFNKALSASEVTTLYNETPCN